MGKEPRFLQLRVQFGGFGSMEHHIAKKVVATSAVPSATTDKRMVAIAVQNPVAKRALSVTVSERDAKPALSQSCHMPPRGQHVDGKRTYILLKI